MKYAALQHRNIGNILDAIKDCAMIQSLQQTEKLKMSKPFISGNWHAWSSNGQVLLSNEVLKKLYSFWNVDEAINWLYVHGNKPAARELNSHKLACKAT